MKFIPEHKLKVADIDEVIFHTSSMEFELHLTAAGRAKLKALSIPDSLSFTVETEVDISAPLEACCAIAAPGLFFLSESDDAPFIYMAFNGIPDECSDDVYIDEGETIECLRSLPKALLKPAIDVYFARLAYMANCKTLLFTLPEPLNVESSTTHWLVKNSSARPLRDFRALSNHGKYYIRGFIWNLPGTAAPAEAAKWEN